MMHGDIYTIYVKTPARTGVEMHPFAIGRKKIGYTTFALGDHLLSGSDALPGQHQKPQGFALQFNLNSLLSKDDR